MNRFAVAVAVFVLLALPPAAPAASSLIGPSGLLVVPTAEVLGMTQWNAGVTAVRVDDESDETVYYANVGLVPRFELGISRDKFEGREAETLLNGKLHVLGPLPAQVTLAFGMLDITDQIDRTAYVVGTHDLGAGVLTPRGRFTRPQVHVGVGSGRFDGLFGGFSVTVSGRTDAMVEYDGDDLNLGVRWPIIDNVNLTVASLDGFDDLAASISASSPW